MNFARTKKITVSFFALLVFFSAGVVRAATITSTTAGGDWGTTTTWVGGIVPANTDTAVVATTVGRSVTISANKTIANVTVNPGATLTFSGAFTLTINGKATVNGTVNGGTGVLKMNLNPSVLDGTGTINSTITIQQPTSIAATANLNTTAIITLANTLTINSGGVLSAIEIDSNKKTVANNGTVNLSGNYLALASPSVWTQGTNAVVNIGGTFTPSASVTLNATNSSNTVNYNGGTQAVEPASYVNLTFSGSGAKSIVTGTSVSGVLSIAPTGTATASIGAGLSITVANLTLGGLGRINGTWGSTSSTASFQNNTYFAATTGILSVTNDTRATPTLSVANSPVTYNATPRAATVSASVAGTISNILTGGAATQTNAGTYAVTANFTPTDTTSYKSLTSASAGNFVINKATPTISVTNSPVTYNGFAQSATIAGSVLGTASSVLYNGSATVPTAAGTYAVTANFAPTDTTNYNSLTGAAAGNFIIAKATPTLSVTNSPVTYNAAPQSATVIGSVLGVVSNIKYNGSATVPTNAATYAITADFAPTDTINYSSLAGASAGNFVINKATPTLSVTNSPVVYDGAAHAATVSGSVAGTASNFLTGGAATQTAAGTYAVTANFAPTDTTNYNSLTGAAAGNFIIAKATPTLSVTNSPVTYNAAPQSATVIGSVLGVVSNIKYNGSATVPTNAATYAITADFAPTDTINYSSLAGASAGNFMISNMGQMITFSALSDKVYGDADFALLATASSGFTVSFASQTPAVCTVSTATAHIVSVGICTIRASQAGDSNYSAAPNVDRSFNIIAKTLSVSGIAANNKIYDGNTIATLNTSAAALVGVVSGDTVAINTGSAVGTFATANVGTGISVQISGLTISGTSVSNYTLAQPTTTATISNPTPTTTSITPNQIAVGSPSFTLTVNGTNFVPSSTVLWNGSSRSTIFVSSSQLTAQVLAGDLATVGTSTVAVVNTTPGGGTSNNQVFTVFNPVDVTPPAVTAFVIASTSASLTVPVTTLIATDNVGVTGYLLTESSTTPSVGDSRWVTTAPTSFVFSSQGGKTLYAWAKDLAGNISTSSSATTIITLPDTTAPTVTAFVVPATSSTLTVNITTLTATDNVGVMGYLITEASTTPALNVSGWSAAAPSTYTFTLQGDKTLYAWAKDAAGNISSSMSVATSITFVEVSPNQITTLFNSGTMVPNNTVASSTQVTFNQSVHVVYGGGSTVVIPLSATLNTTAPSDWRNLNGTTVVSTNDLPANYISAGALQWGLPGTALTASQAVTVQINVDSSFNGQTLTVFKKEEGGTAWTSYTTCVVGGGICQFTTTSFSSFSAAWFKTPPVTSGSTPAPRGEAVSPTKVNFTGQAYPGSTVQVFFKSSQDGQYRAVPQGTYIVSADGTFDVDYTGLFGGDYLFGLQAEDKAGNKSGIVQASVNLLSEDKLIVRNIFLPPTLSILRTGIRLGDVLSVSGYAAAGSTIEFEIDGKLYPTTLVAGSDGYYKALINTAQFGYGTHLVRVRQKNADRTSPFSSNKAYAASKVFFPLTDLNNDGKIDITDWSIFLSLWTAKDETARRRIDFNRDGKVDLTDFSIFMQSLKAAANNQ